MSYFNAVIIQIKDNDRTKGFIVTDNGGLKPLE